VHGRDDVIQGLERARLASASAGSKFLSGFLRASQVAIAGNSVSTEPSSFCRVGTLDFGLIFTKSGPYCSCLAPSIFCRS